MPVIASARRAVLLSLLAVCAGASVPALAADAYPDKPIRLIVPYPRRRHRRDRPRAGPGADRRAGTDGGRGEPRGAAGNIGADQVAKAPADGYTLLMGALTSHSINAALYRGRVTYDVEKSFAPVSIVGTVPLVFVVNPSVQATSLSQLIALAKSKPGYITMGSAGNGSPQHRPARCSRAAGVDILHVPYKGSGPAMTDLMGGQVLSMIETVPAAQGSIKAGKLRALAVTSAERVPALPDTPTAAEAGLKDFEVSSMFGIVAPAGTPAPVVERLNGELKKILAKPDVKASLLNQGAIATWTTPADAGARVSAEVARWTKVIDEAGVKPE